MWHSPIPPLYDLCHSDQREESASGRHRCAADDSRFLTGLTPFRNDRNFRKAWDVASPKGSNPVSYPVQAATSLCPTREAAAAAG